MINFISNIFKKKLPDNRPKPDLTKPRLPNDITNLIFTYMVQPEYEFDSGLGLKKISELDKMKLYKCYGILTNPYVPISKIRKMINNEKPNWKNISSNRIICLLGSCKSTKHVNLILEIENYQDIIFDLNTMFNYRRTFILNSHAIDLVDELYKINPQWFHSCPDTIRMIQYCPAGKNILKKINKKYYRDIYRNPDDSILDKYLKYPNNFDEQLLLLSNTNTRAFIYGICYDSEEDKLYNIEQSLNNMANSSEYILKRIVTALASNPSYIAFDNLIKLINKLDQIKRKLILAWAFSCDDIYSNTNDDFIDWLGSHIIDETYASIIKSNYHYLAQNTNPKATELLYRHVSFNENVINLLRPNKGAAQFIKSNPELFISKKWIFHGELYANTGLMIKLPNIRKINRVMSLIYKS